MLSTRQAAKQLGLDAKTLSRYIAVGKVPAPKILHVGSASLHGWTEEDIQRVRQLLPKIANGRKTRYKKQSAPTARRGRLSSQQSAKTKAQPKKAVPRKKRSSQKPKPASG